MNSESVALILLAAGESSRFRGEKLLTDFGGKPLLQWSLDNLESVVALEKILVLKPGFEIENSDVLTGDALSEKVSWKGRTEITSLKDKTVRIYIKMYKAKLFSIKM